MSDNGKQGKGKLANFSIIRPAATKPTAPSAQSKPQASSPAAQSKK